MVNLLMRRRSMPDAVAMPEWDYEWTYLGGALPEDSGLVKTTHLATNGVATIALRSTDARITTKISGSYIQHTYADSNPSKAVLQMSWKADSANTSHYNIVSLSNGVNGIAVRCQLTSSTAKFLLCDSSDMGSMTQLADYAVNKTYTLKLVLDGNTGSVYLNGSLLKDNIDPSTIYYADSTRFYCESRSSYNRYTYWYNFRLKLGRTS